MRAQPVPLPLPDPALATPGLSLRPWAESDAASLAAAWADTEVARWTGTPANASEELARRWIAGDSHRRARGLALDLVIDVGGSPAGEVGLVRVDSERRVGEVGWWVAADHRGKGLASAAVGVFCAWVVEELCVDVVVARCDPANPAAGAVAGKAGFQHRGQVDGRDVWAFGGLGAAMISP